MTKPAPLLDPEIRVDRVAGGMAIVSLAGEHDLASTPAVKDTLASLLDAEAEIVIDLASAQYLDCSVVRVLDQAGREAAARGRQIRFRLQTHPSVRRLLELAGLLEEWAVYETQAEALDSMRRAPTPPSPST